MPFFVIFAGTEPEIVPGNAGAEGTAAENAVFGFRTIINVVRRGRGRGQRRGRGQGRGRGRGRGRTETTPEDVAGSSNSQGSCQGPNQGLSEGHAHIENNDVGFVATPDSKCVKLLTKLFFLKWIRLIDFGMK